MDGLIEDSDALFAEIFHHLSNVEAQPTDTVLDQELLKRGERSLDASTPQTLLWRILGTGQNLLQTIQQDPRPLTRLLERTVLLIPFDDLKTSISAEKLEEGLQSPSIPIQLLCLAYLRKASDTPSGASFVACSPSLVQTLVTQWLASESTEVAERCLEDIVALLEVDNPEKATRMSSSNGIGEAEGHGLFWRRIFNDRDIYTLLFCWTSFVNSNHDLSVKKGQQAITISQARLFDFIARVAPLDWKAITTTVQPDVERAYTRGDNSGGQPYGGLLKYAANGMIDKNDSLMELLRQDLFVKLFNVLQDSNRRGVSSLFITAIEKESGVEPERIIVRR